MCHRFSDNAKGSLISNITSQSTEMVVGIISAFARFTADTAAVHPTLNLEAGESTRFRSLYSKSSARFCSRSAGGKLTSARKRSRGIPRKSWIIRRPPLHLQKLKVFVGKGKHDGSASHEGGLMTPTSFTRHIGDIPRSRINLPDRGNTGVQSRTTPPAAEPPSISLFAENIT